MCETVDEPLVLAWSEGRGNHLRCEDNTGCLLRLLRRSSEYANVIPIRRRGSPLPEAA